MNEPTPSGHRVGPALVAVLVALAAAAGTFGYLVTRRVVTQPAAGAATNSPTRTSATPRAGSPRPPTANPDIACPAVTVAAVRAAGLNADLRLLLYVRTHQDGVIDSEVWICWNADDRLIYQGHLMSAGLGSADNGVNTLLLAEGIKGKVERDGEGFKATNPAGNKITEYRVSKERLEIRNVGGGSEVHPVVEVRP